jgi:phage terminase small subunit
VAKPPTAAAHPVLNLSKFPGQKSVLEAGRNRLGDRTQTRRKFTMTQAGRKSSASLSAISVDGQPERLRPPPELTEIEAKIFLDLVTSVKSSHFQASDLPLFCAYVRACADEAEASARKREEGAVVNGKRNPWDSVQRDAAKTMGNLAGLLRLTPRARATNNPTRPQPANAYERMRLERQNGSIDRD